MKRVMRDKLREAGADLREKYDEETLRRVRDKLADEDDKNSKLSAEIIEIMADLE